MPNQVTSHNERTLFKAVRALVDGGLMPFGEAMKTVDCLIDAGLLIREPAEKEDSKKVDGGNVRGVGN